MIENKKKTFSMGLIGCLQNCIGFCRILYIYILYILAGYSLYLQGILHFCKVFFSFAGCSLYLQGILYFCRVFWVFLQGILHFCEVFFIFARFSLYFGWGDGRMGRWGDGGKGGWGDGRMGGWGDGRMGGWGEGGMGGGKWPRGLAVSNRGSNRGL